MFNFDTALSYTDETLKQWLQDIEDYNNKNNTDYILLPHMALNAMEIKRELIRRDNIRDFLSDLE